MRDKKQNSFLRCFTSAMAMKVSISAMGNVKRNVLFHDYILLNFFEIQVVVEL